MPKRITKLTPEQTAQFDAHADKWIEIGLRTGPADRPRMEAALEKVYGYAGLRWHGNVVWVSSPLVLAFAAPTAAFLLDRGAVDRAVDEAVDRAVDGAVDGAVGGSVDRAVRGSVSKAVDGAVDRAVRGSVSKAVDGAVDEAVRGSVSRAVDGAVHGSVDEAVRGSVDRAVRGSVGGSVDRAVRGAVRESVSGSVSGGWKRYIGGQFWVGGWGWGGAWTSFFREVAGLELPGDLWDRALTYEATLESACWWWPHREFVMVCERPTAIHRELVDSARPRGWGSHRLHCDDGPAVVWPDGWGVYALHGVRVPADLIETDWDADRILREENQEVRRVAIERLGWEHFTDGFTLVHEDADPANAGNRLRLYDVPDDIYGEPVRVLLATNGTAERDGTVRRFGLTTPAAIETALEAAAWTYGLDKTEYAALQRRT